MLVAQKLDYFQGHIGMANNNNFDRPIGKINLVFRNIKNHMVSIFCYK